MPITVGEFMSVLERLAPAALAEEWDNCGLQVGARDITTEKILVALNVTAAVLAEAEALGSNIVLTHHPLIFRPLNSISDDCAAGLLARRAATAGIAVIAAHTNLDAAPGGLADIMANMLGLASIEPIATVSRGDRFKLVVFVPPQDLDAVRAALFANGAGIIGAYGHCSWFTAGTGTFLPLEGANPAIGRVGADETIAELRLETVVAGADLETAVAAMVAAHSYEEPAYDIYPLVTLKQGTAAGRRGVLTEAVAAPVFAREVARRFGIREARFTAPSALLVKRVAVVPGSGAGFISRLGGKVDMLVTGDIKYHDALEAGTAGLGLVDLPHDVSETVALMGWLPELERALAGSGVAVVLSTGSTSVWDSTTIENDRGDAVAVTESTGTWRLHVDGGARGNPGPAGIGAVLFDGDGNAVAELAETIGEATNNVAEYKALIAGITLAAERGITRLEVYSDSELIVKQLQGSYKVKNEGLRPLYEQAAALLAALDSYRLFAISREKNAHADALVNQALDRDSSVT